MAFTTDQVIATGLPNSRREIVGDEGGWLYIERMVLAIFGLVFVIVGGAFLGFTYSELDNCGPSCDGNGAVFSVGLAGLLLLVGLALLASAIPAAVQRRNARRIADRDQALRRLRGEMRGRE